MSVPSLLRFAAVYSSDPKLARSRMVQRGALETLTRDQEIPVVVDHDMSRQVGRVREIFVAPDYQGGDWYWASVELTGPPGWLRRDGAVSWSHVPLREQDVNGTTRLLRGIVKEISILSPSVQPAEPRARVEWIGEPVKRSAGEVIHHPPGTKQVRRGLGQVLGVR